MVMARDDTASPIERVELVDEEHVVAHGTASTVWFVRVKDAWVPAAQVEGAVVEALDAGPGMVWRRRIELSLSRGTRVLRVESSPLTQRRSPLEYLERGAKKARKQHRVEYRVGPRSTLERA